MDTTRRATQDLVERPLEDLGVSSVSDEQEDKDRECGSSRVKAAIRRIMEHDHFRLVLALLLGQILSLLLCGTGTTSQLLETNYAISVPTTQAFINYFLLGAIFGTLLAVKSDFLKILWKNWWKYVLLGLIDVEANYMIILAYKYTTLTTIQLLDSFTIACVMVLSFIFLRIRYKIINLMGVVLSLIGILSLVLATIMGSRGDNGSNPLLGDLLCFGGSALYAISNVAQEFLVKNHSIVEYLGLLGVSGSFVAAIQLIILERESLARIEWNVDIGLLFLGFGVAMFLFYSIMPHVMKLSSAVVVNLSLLTADIYTLFVGLYVFHFTFSFFYIMALFLIITGIFIYNIRLPRVAAKKEKKKDSKQPISDPKASDASNKDIESSQDSHRGVNLRDLLESSNLETSTTSSAKVPKKKRPRLREVHSIPSVSTTEGSPLSCASRSWRRSESSSPVLPSSFSYGSIQTNLSSSFTIPSDSNPSSYSSTGEQQMALKNKGTKSKLSLSINRTD